jgi:subtilisin family serine protease
MEGETIMRRRFLVLLTFAAAIAVGSAADAGQFILRARSSADAEVICQRYGLVDVKTVHVQGTDEICVVTANTSSPAEDNQLKTLVSADPLVESFEIDRSLTLAESAPSSAALAQSTAAILEGFAGQPPVVYFGATVPAPFVAQPALGLIRLADARPFATGAGIVAVIDTGVDPTHPAIADALVPGFDFVNNVPGFPTDLAELAQSTAAILEQSGVVPPDSVALLNQSTAAILEQSTAAILESAQLPAAFGHGTMVASLIRLVAPTAGIMPLKAFRADGSAELSDLVAAIYYAVDNGATVINMSFTLVAPSPALLDAINYAASQHVLCVAAMGNAGVQSTDYPAAYPGVVAVASTSMADQRSAFSNYGSRVDVSAPGEGLVTAYPGNHYAMAWGTSFSTALVSGTMALVHQYKPRISEDSALKLLEHGAWVPSYLGKARLDLYRALFSLLDNNCP